MERKKLLILLGCEAALCVFLSLAGAFIAESFGWAFAFPFKQIGLSLRALSLLSDAGNAAAVAIYFLLCLLPMLSLPLLRRKRRLAPEDALLALLSPLLFWVLYLAVNPALIGESSVFPEMSAWGLTLLGGAVYSLLLTYGVLRILRLFFTAGKARLIKHLGTALKATAAIFTFLIFGVFFSELTRPLLDADAGLIQGDDALFLNRTFLFLRFLVSALPYGLDIAVIFSALDLLKEAAAGRYSEASLAAAGRLSRICRRTLVITMFSSLAFNLLQLPFMDVLMSVSVSIQLPLLPAFLAVAALILARLMGENKRLKDDNDMFI